MSIAQRIERLHNPEVEFCPEDQGEIDVEDKYQFQQLPSTIVECQIELRRLRERYEANEIDFSCHHQRRRGELRGMRFSLKRDISRVELQLIKLMREAGMF